jgi:hypothetical protein
MSLDNVSKSFKAPRDALVEYSVQRLLPVIAKEREKHEKRKAVLGEIEEHFKTGEKLLKKIKDALGDEDPIYYKLETVMAVYENTYNSIESFIEKGKIIEDFDPEVLSRMFQK